MFFAGIFINDQEKIVVVSRENPTYHASYSSRKKED
ncbi:hypothetical protein PCC21_006960 [Pectobacterium carotovorum subsp. carotovorum PCC21]|nr:hypothetical protein PCC21_006960 [Pectobacterium carotovorum subsp. carotovorum PCC21]